MAKKRAELSPVFEYDGCKPKEILFVHKLSNKKILTITDYGKDRIVIEKFTFLFESKNIDCKYQMEIGSYNDVIVSNDNKYIMICFDSKIWVQDLSTERCVAWLFEGADAGAFSEDNRQIALYNAGNVNFYSFDPAKIKLELIKKVKIAGGCRKLFISTKYNRIIVLDPCRPYANSRLRILDIDGKKQYGVTFVLDLVSIQLNNDRFIGFSNRNFSGNCIYNFDIKTGGWSHKLAWYNKVKNNIDINSDGDFVVCGSGNRLITYSDERKTEHFNMSGKCNYLRVLEYSISELNRSFMMFMASRIIECKDILKLIYQYIGYKNETKYLIIDNDFNVLLT